MTYDTIIQLIAMVLVGVSVVGLTTFMITYARHADWRKTGPGRAIMYLSGTMWSVLALTLVNAFVGDYYGREYVALAVLGAMAFVVWRLVYVLRAALKLEPFYIFRIRRTPTKKEQKN